MGSMSMYEYLLACIHRVCNCSMSFCSRGTIPNAAELVPEDLAGIDILRDGDGDSWISLLLFVLVRCADCANG